MLQTMNPYPTAARTAEIMARYRPIAPKPEASACPNSSGTDAALPPSISRSPFLRDVWAQLQARPTRTRKRGRSTALAPPPSPLKRPTPCFQGISPSPYRLISFNGGPPVLPKLVTLKCGLDRPASTLSSSISVPSLPCASPPARTQEERGRIDLNRAASEDEGDEEDFSGPVRPSPVRPVGSSIYVGCITPAAAEEKEKEEEEKQGMKRLEAEEVEEEVETEVLPAVVSDSKNKVRLANSAYKEMVGQPECCWLDYMRPGVGGKGMRRIGGEVVLQFMDPGDAPISSDRFTCWVSIEWRSNEKKNSVRAFCDAVKLGCQSRDYLFEWRFHPTEASSSSSSEFKDA